MEPPNNQREHQGFIELANDDTSKLANNARAALVNPIASRKARFFAWAIFTNDPEGLSTDERIEFACQLIVTMADERDNGPGHRAHAVARVLKRTRERLRKALDDAAREEAEEAARV
ncbi:hypothetical protein MN608_08601 [Microdochium nivale]|nr:hypothetical protein MN608_08601 [Microdochium nivale]